MAYDGNIEVYNHNEGVKIVVRKVFTKKEDVSEILRRAFDGEEIIVKARIVDRKTALIKLNNWGVDVDKYM